MSCYFTCFLFNITPMLKNEKKILASTVILFIMNLVITNSRYGEHFFQVPIIILPFIRYTLIRSPVISNIFKCPVVFVITGVYFIMVILTLILDIMSVVNTKPSLFSLFLNVPESQICFYLIKKKTL